MIKIFCDRCGKPIEGTTYYVPSITAKDINPTDDSMTYAKTASHNTSQVLQRLRDGEKHCCEECRDKIEKFIANTEQSKTTRLEELLSEIGVSLTNHEGEYRSINDVLHDIANKWSL